jgi:hypothetical protein
MGRGVATLARLSGAPALPIGVGWNGERIRPLLGEPIAPAPAPPAAWELAWLTAYVAQVDRWSRLAPENLHAVGNLYDWLARDAG